MYETEKSASAPAKSSRKQFDPSRAIQAAQQQPKTLTPISRQDAPEPTAKGAPKKSEAAATHEEEEEESVYETQSEQSNFLQRYRAP